MRASSAFIDAQTQSIEARLLQEEAIVSERTLADSRRFLARDVVKIWLPATPPSETR